MARFEQPTYEVGRGGGIDMNEEALWVIEKYLQLVREYLDESIAEDVLGEIRAYLIEAAEDLSQDEITVEAAKKVVAGFGAPSEVAKEYATSLSTEVVEETLEESLVKSQELQKPPEVQQDEIQEVKTSEVSYVFTFAKIITLTVVWLTIGWTFAAIFAPWFLTTTAATFPFFQFIILSIAFAIMLRETKKKGLKLWDRTYPEWSGLQKLLTFPENSPLKPTENTRILDIMLSVLGIGFYVTTLLHEYSSYEYSFFVNFVALPMSILLILRAVIIIRELGGIDPAHFVRQEFAIDAISLVFLNITLAWAFSSTPLFWPIGSILWWYALIFGLNIYYQLDIKGQELWWKIVKAPIEEPKHPEEIKMDSTKLAVKTKKVAIKSLLKITAIYIAMPLIGYFMTIISGVQLSFSYWNMFGFIPIFFDFIFWILAIVLCSAYFGGRYYLIKSRGRTEIIRKRTRKESVVDLIGTGIILMMALVIFPFIFGRSIPDFIQWIEDSSLQYRFVMLSIQGYLFVFLYLGIVARVISDIVNIVWRETKFSLESMYFSGVNLIITTTCLFVLHFAAHDFFFYRLDLLLVFALISLVVISFQTVTSGIKLSWIKKNKKVGMEDSIEIA